MYLISVTHCCHLVFNRRYNLNVTGCLLYVKILHYKVLQDACHILMRRIVSFLQKMT